MTDTQESNVSPAQYADLLPLFHSGEWATLPPDVADLLDAARRLHDGMQRRAKANGMHSGFGALSALYLAHALGKFAARPGVGRQVGRR